MPNFHGGKPPLDQKLLASLEAVFGRLPDGYRAFLHQFNGGTPLPYGFDFLAASDPHGRVGTVLLKELFPAEAHAGLHVNAFIEAGVPPYFAYTEGFPHGLLAIGEMPWWGRKSRSEFLLLSLRSEDRGRVYYYVDTPGPTGCRFDPEKLFPVAPDFDSFLAKLDWPVSCRPWLPAIETGDVAAIEAWLAEGGDVDRKDAIVRGTPLEAAAIGPIAMGGSLDLTQAQTAILRLMLPHSWQAVKALKAFCSNNWFALDAIVDFIDDPKPLKSWLTAINQESKILHGYEPAVAERFRTLFATLQPKLKAKIKGV